MSEKTVTYTADRAAFSARVGDLNGWYEVKRNPISRVGVFDYLGSSLPGAPDPGRVYRVYRPAEELADPEFLDSLRLLPFIDEHEMLGPEDAGYTPPEDRGVHGVIGEAVEFDGQFVRGNLKIFSDALARAIDNGKRELSLGYRCVYDWVAGEFEGVKYDAVQRKLRGNHLALVGAGRMGPAVAVLDHNSTFTVDHLEFVNMTDKTENTGDGGEGMTIASAVAAIEAIKPLIAALGAAPAAPMEDKEAKPGEGDAPAEQSPAEMAAAVDRANTVAAVDAKLGTIAKALDALANRPAPVLDHAEVARAIREDAAKRDDLVRRLTPHVGAFDSAAMSYAEVAAYGVTKLGLTAPKGAEGVALDAYLYGREPARALRITTATDGATDSPVAKFIAGK